MAVSALALTLACAGTAQAAPIVKVGKSGKARVVRDRAVPPQRETALPRHGRTKLLAPPVLARAAAALTSAQQQELDEALAAARTARDARPVGSVRRAELSAVIANAEALQGSGQLTSSRLAAVLMTLRRNTQYWANNAPPAAGARVVFTGSPVLLEYYPGEGLEIQPLANFAKANSLWGMCKTDRNTTCSKLRDLLDALLALAAQRGSFAAWEYYFDFEGGVPPWTSSMSQGTALQALSRAYNLTGETRYRDAAKAAVGAFQAAPPLGVATPATGGTHYLVYSYAPKLFIFGGFLQSLTGLDDYRDYVGDPLGTTLFRAGHGNALAIVPGADTGSWSRYSVGGPDSTLEQHLVLTDVLDSLCHRQGSATYCTLAARFAGYTAARTG